ncbi:MAG: RimK family alpha-L-glutamate ligase [Candidatus Nanohaloarchaea archaeon]
MTKNIGVLWDESVQSGREEPFEKDAWNSEYRIFSDIAGRHGLRFYLAEYTEYEEGVLGEAYTVEEGEWVVVNDVRIEGVFDKFLFNEETFDLKKRMAEEVGILNDPELERLCKDKLETAERFSRVPETRKATEENITEFLEDGKAVVKPRYDFGGRGVQIIGSMDELEPVDPERAVVQRFIDTSGGIPGTGYDGVHDLRAYVVDGELTFGLVRVPEEGLVSNVALGGSQFLFPAEDFRDDALELVDQVKEELSVFSPAMYSVDMVYDENGTVWIVELNSKPGLSFYSDQEMKEAVLKTVERLCSGLERI